MLWHCRSDLAARQGDLVEAKAQLAEVNAQLADSSSDKDILRTLFEQSQADLRALREEAVQLKAEPEAKDGVIAELTARVQVSIGKWCPCVVYELSCELRVRGGVVRVPCSVLFSEQRVQLCMVAAISPLIVLRQWAVLRHAAVLQTH